MSIIGFIVGLIVAIVFYAIAVSLVTFAHSLVFALMGLLIVLAFTFDFDWERIRVRR